ncbi:hypothetical protein B0H66DRAFT_244823 [Apodospora peruviana]|uniref:Uncharacterized protein n=1 Tax=Apodospora peruviana TaxID=516989 RepID=A0AAE0M4N8_9PEZI|nr:hypothetical protein B0H66DRAFT_244823 [Apodospora peruviana]
MPVSVAATPSADDARVKAILESQSLKFHIRTGSNKWRCTVTDRATAERLRAAKEAASSSAVSTTSSNSSTSSPPAAPTEGSF